MRISTFLMASLVVVGSMLALPMMAAVALEPTGPPGYDVGYGYGYTNVKLHDATLLAMAGDPASLMLPEEVQVLGGDVSVGPGSRFVLIDAFGALLLPVPGVTATAVDTSAS